MHKSLYRKYRPLSFFDVVGQEHITATLKNEIASGTVAHAYLFTGTRGTGKTTCAKIFAKAVNCLNPVNGNPCNDCASCRGISSGEIMDIIEIDAASNNSVDDVRELREDVIYSPSVSKYKVYIIDEVHMLSTSAFNALLKTLEEPPAHVIFILATTEINKVPMTVLSRCQRFDFRRLTVAEISDRLSFICDSEKIAYEKDALRLIARLGDGSVRDAISILDQCAGSGEKLTVAQIEVMTQSTGRASLFRLAKTVSDADYASAVSVLSELYYSSKDLSRLNEELVGFYRDLMIIKAVPDPSALVICSEDDMKSYKSLAAATKQDDVLFRIGVLQDCLERMPRTVNKRVALEMAFLKMITGGTRRAEPEDTVDLTPMQSVETKPAALQHSEKTVESVNNTPVSDKSSQQPMNDSVSFGASLSDTPPWETSDADIPKTPAAAANAPATAKAVPAPKPVASAPKPAAQKKAAPRSDDGYEKWPEALNVLKSSGKFNVWAMLVGSKAEKSGDKLIIRTANEASAEFLNDKEIAKAITDAVLSVSGESLTISAGGEKKKQSGDIFDSWLESNKDDIELI